MDRNTATSLLRWDIDWWSLFLGAWGIGIISLSFYRLGGPASMGAAVIPATLFWMVLGRNRLIVRHFCVGPPPLLSDEEVLLRVAATLQEFPTTPFVRKFLPPFTGGWLYVTGSRLIFQGRKRTIPLEYAQIRAIDSEPHGGWWWGIYVNARRIHVWLPDGRVTVAVRYPHLLRRQIEDAIAANRRIAGG